MKLLALALAAAAVAAAAEKPTPRQKARELLDSAAEMIAATHPDVQAAALYHLADNYGDFDRKKALEYFKQAFTAAGSPASSSSPVFGSTMQMEIVVALTGLDAEEGVAMLKLIPAPSGGYDVRSFAAARVIGRLVAKGELDRAVQLAEYIGGAGAYPFDGVSQILGKLKPDDPRFAAVFSQALTAYTAKPDSSFGRLLARYWRDLPAGMAQNALSRILAVVLDTKTDVPYSPLTIASAKGTVTFTNRVESDLFDIMPLVRELDRKRYEEVFAQHAEVRSALDLFPGGGQSITSEGGWMYTVSGGDRKSAEALNERQKLNALIQNRAMAALEAAAKDPGKGLDLVAGIPSPPKQAEVLGRIAEMTGERDPDTARRVLSRCVSLLDNVKYPDARVVDWDIVAGAAALIKDDALARRAIDKMLSDAAEMYKTDADADRPNRAPRENWPSMQALRRAVIREVKLSGVDAEAMLPKITDPDQTVLARITMAQALLGRPFDRLQSFGRQHPPQTQ